MLMWIVHLCLVFKTIPWLFLCTKGKVGKVNVNAKIHLWGISGAASTQHSFEGDERWQWVKFGKWVDQIFILQEVLENIRNVGGKPRNVRKCITCYRKLAGKEAGWAGNCGFLTKMIISTNPNCSEEYPKDLLTWKNGTKILRSLKPWLIYRFWVL